jgi:hypothetical protein
MRRWQRAETTEARYYIAYHCSRVVPHDVLSVRDVQTTAAACCAYARACGIDHSSWCCIILA